MYDYCLIIHPTNEELLHKYEPGMKTKPLPLVKKVLEWMSPFKAAEIEGLNSHLGRTAKGALVMCPLLMEQMITLSPSKVMKMVISTLEFAKNTLNPKLIGLTAYAAFSGNKGVDLTEIIKTPLTTGSSYTLAMIPEVILQAVNIMDVELDSSDILVIGATSSIGKFCVEVLNPFVRRIFVMGHNADKLNIFLSGLPKDKRDKIHLARDLNSIYERTKIVIVATNRIPTELDIRKLNPGSVVFDSSYPRRIPAGLRNDILVIDGVTIRPPGNVDFHFDFGLPKGLCYPCMAEPMILALERKFEDYSLGRDLSAEKIREITRIGAKHGFQTATLTCSERIISNEEISQIRHNAQKNKKRKMILWR